MAWLEQRQAALGPALVVAALVFVPAAPLKLAGIAAGFLLTGNAGRLPRVLVAGLLFAVFSLAYMVLPYWALLGSSGSQATVLVLLAAAGLLWSAVSSADVSWSYDTGRRDVAAQAVLLAAMCVLLLPGLQASLPFLGDENYHFYVARTLRFGLRHSQWSAFAGFGLIVLWLCAWRLSNASLSALRYASLAPLLLSVLCFVPLVQESYAQPKAGLFHGELLRYPMFSCWFRALALRTPADAFDPALNRLIPAASYLVLGLCAYRMQHTAVVPWLRGLLAAAVVSVPTLAHYSTVCYLEMPMVACAFVVCMNLDRLLRADSRELRGQIAWIALLLMGFLKETSAPFVAALGLAYAVAQTRLFLANTSAKTGRSAAQWLLNLAAAAFSMALPIAVYLLFRQLEATRSYSPDPSIIWTKPDFFSTLVFSYWRQFLAAGLLAIPAAIYLVLRRQWLFVLANLWLFLACLTFFSLDNAAYIGYARFLLVCYAPVAAVVLRAAGLITCSLVNTNHKIAFAAVVAAVTVFHLSRSPVALDGTRPPDTGLDRSFSTSERYYPYDKLTQWLAANAQGARVKVVGLSFDYDFSFYGSRYGWRGSMQRFNSPDLPDSKAERQHLLSATAQLQSAPLDLLVWNKQNGLYDSAVDQPPVGYEFVHAVSNSRHSIVIYRKKAA